MEPTNVINWEKALIEDDGLHFDYRLIDGYNCSINFIISEREPGKTTAYLRKAFAEFLKGYTVAFIVRNSVEITEAYIDGIGEVIRNFCAANFKFDYDHSKVKKGCPYVDLYVNGNLFGRIYALSNPIGRIKKIGIQRCSMLLFDEFIINPRFGEKYLKDEAVKFNELYTTIRRFSPNGRLRAFFLGNPYSLFNPYFVRYNVPSTALKRGNVYRNGECLVMCYEMKQELREKILRDNPLYQFDDAYKKYAFDGQAINDANIPVAPRPPSFALKYVFKIENKMIGIFRNQNYNGEGYRYSCEYVDDISARRAVFCLDFAEMTAGTVLLTREDRFYFEQFKRAMQRRQVAFSCIECYYLIEEIYFNL